MENVHSNPSHINVHQRNFLFRNPFVNLLFEVQEANEKGETALHFAAHQTDSAITQILLQNGIDVNHVDKEGNTALLIATDAQNYSVIELLLDQSAIDINRPNNHLHTPFMVATWKKDLKLMKTLFEK